MQASEPFVAASVRTTVQGERACGDGGERAVMEAIVISKSGANSASSTSSMAQATLITPDSMARASNKGNKRAAMNGNKELRRTNP